MDSFGFAVVALAVLVFGLISRRVQHSIITLPIVFVVFGFLIGPHGLDWVAFHVDDHFVHTLAELTLVLVLFTDASRIDLNLLRRQNNLPVRLLVVGLPLTILVGALVGVAIFSELSFWGAVILAIILAPTDAALGQAVVSSPKVPVRIRQALNVESGLNDGVVLPVLLIILSVACATADVRNIGYWIEFTALQLILGPLVGIGVAYLGGHAVDWATRKKWMDHPFQQLAALSLSLLSFTLAHLVGGNGFIAAFCAGLTLGNLKHPVCECLYEFAEAEGQLLTLLVFMIFGAVMVPDVVEHFSVSTVLYAVLSLTVIRMLPVGIALLGAGLQKNTILFFGWFGPRGLASILFALLVLDQSELPGREILMPIVLTTVLFSVFAHGVTAYPGSLWYSKKIKKEHIRAGEEMQKVDEMPTRIALRAEEK